MLSRISHWWLRRANLKKAESLVQLVFPSMHVYWYGLTPPHWFPLDDFKKSIGVDSLQLYGNFLTFANQVLLSVPSESQDILYEHEFSYFHHLNEWASEQLVSPERVESAQLIRRFLHWRFPKVFLDTHGIEVFNVLEVTSSSKRQEKTIGQFLSYLEAINFLKMKAQGKKIFWGRPAVDVSALYSTSAERGGDWKEKSDEELLAIWGRKSEPLSFPKGEHYVTLYFESQALNFYADSKRLLACKFYEIERTVTSPTKDSMSDDRLITCRDLIIAKVHFDDEELEVLDNFFTGFDELDAEECLILASKIDQIERFA